jgi:hypothetical protein
MKGQIFVRTYLNTLLHRKRGEYGPLWLFELDDEVWAIVWSGWLEDEEICYAILSEDAQWFNREWGNDGRRPNPTYRTQCTALEEIIRSLRTMKANLQTGDVEQRKYALYISVAEHDLHQALIDYEADDVPAGDVKFQMPTYVPAGLQTAGHEPMPEPVEAPTEPEETPPPPASRAVEVKAQPKPWENASEQPKGLNFQPEATLHAKMNWVCDNVPKMSRLRILREGAELLCNMLIEKHYRNQG